jgi:tyrosyl-tRNA synthetase
MSKFASEFLRILEERGFIHQGSDSRASTPGQIGLRHGYVGYDCTAPSLHVGHLLTIMMLHWLQHTGGKPIVLMGGGTTRVGDPSGRDETRRILSPDDIEANKQSIKSVFSRLLASARRDRRHHGRQCRVAGQAQLHRVPARRRPAFLGQPHAVDGLGASCGWSASRSCRSSSSTT